MGKIRSPHYRIVVADSRTKRDGRSIEEIGLYNPTENPSFMQIDSERAQYWLSVGAQPSPQVLAILKLSGDWGKFKGDKNAKNMIQTKDAKVVFTEDTSKKSVVRPRVEKKVEEAAPVTAEVVEDVTEAPAEAVETVEETVVETEVVADAPAADDAPVDEAAAEEAPAADEAPADDAPAADEAAADETAE
jgi:small subunit ribosomal protein S16